MGGRECNGNASASWVASRAFPRSRAETILAETTSAQAGTSCTCRHLRRYIARYSLAAPIYRQYYQRRRLAPDWLGKVQFWRAS